MSGGLFYAVYERPLAEPFRYGNKAVGSRRGILLRKGSGADAIYSEAAPLPGHSTDTLEEVLDALAELSARDSESLPPSLRFAIEGLRAQEAPGAGPVRSSALVAWDGPEKARARIAEVVRSGYRTCKLKILPQTWREALGVMEESPELRFRLDANQSLDAAGLERLLGELDRKKLLARVEYLEEPFKSVWACESFRESPVPLAADESAPMAAQALALLAERNPPSVFIVKPTVAGGLFSLEGYLSLLRDADRKFVFTSTLETEAGRRALLSYLSRAPRETAGLSTGHLFAHDHLGDRAEWNEIPPPGQEELRYYSSLSWKDCR